MRTILCREIMVISKIPKWKHRFLPFPVQLLSPVPIQAFKILFWCLSSSQQKETRQLFFVAANSCPKVIAANSLVSKFHKANKNNTLNLLAPYYTLQILYLWIPLITLLLALNGRFQSTEQHSNAFQMIKMFELCLSIVEWLNWSKSRWLNEYSIVL